MIASGRTVLINTTLISLFTIIFLSVYNNDCNFFTINCSKNEYHTSACRISAVDPNHPDTRKFIFQLPQIQCKKIQEEYVRFDEKKSLISLNPDLDTTNIKCAYGCVINGFGEFTPAVTVNATFITNKWQVVSCQVIEAYCWNHKKIINRVIYVDIFINLQKSKRKIASASPERPSVAFYILEAVTQLIFHRHLPKTKKYLLELGAIEMKSHVKVGSSSLPNYMAMMTGLRMRVDDAAWEGGAEDEDDWHWKFHDDVPIIQKNFSQNGYITSIAEEYMNLSIYDYASFGLKQKMGDYYGGAADKIMRKLLDQNPLIKSSEDCFGNRPYTSVVLHSWQKQFLEMYKEKASFNHVWLQCCGTHDSINAISKFDDLLLKYFKSIKPLLDNVIFFIAGDHHMRRSKFLETPTGKVDLAKPAFFILLPDKIKKKYPEIVRNLRRNTEVMTTHFDIYTTLWDILKHSKTWKTSDISKQKDWTKLKIRRGLSLFRPIPPRTCEHAGLTNRFCPCRDIELIYPESQYDVPDRVRSAVVQMKNEINSYIDQKNKTHLCHKWERIKEIIEYGKVTVQKDNGLQHFLYIRASFQPLNSNFTAEFSTELSNQEEIILIDNIERLSRYGDTANCVGTRTLRSYCYCIHQTINYKRT